MYCNNVYLENTLYPCIKFTSFTSPKYSKDKVVFKAEYAFFLYFLVL